MRERLVEHGLTLELTAAATSLLIDKGYNADYGARPPIEPSNNPSRTPWPSNSYAKRSKR